MRFVRVALAFTIASLLLVGVATARPPGVPSTAVVVAGPTADGTRLYVWDSHGHLCGSATRPHSRFVGSSCGGRPESLREPFVSQDGNRVMWGAVEPEVASVELVTTRNRRFAAPTTDGPAYHGRYAGKVRFFLLEGRMRRGEAPLYLRQLDANGALLAAADLSYESQAARAHQTRVASGRFARARWTLNVYTSRQLASLPGDEERLVTRHCVSLDAVHGDTNTCDVPDFTHPAEVALSRSCGPIGIEIAGLAAPGVRMEAVLGDGSRRRLNLRALPRAFDGRRAFALMLSPAVALRQLATIEGGRRRILIGGLAPGLIDCPDSSTGYIFGLYGEFPPFGSQPPALRLHDDGVLLCATLGHPDPENRDCARPPLDPEYSWVLTHVTDDATVFAGIVPPEVGSAEVVVEGGQRQTVPTGADPLYSGRYRDLIRTFAVSIPGGRPPQRVVLYGLDGKRLASIRVYTEPTFEVEPTLLKRTRSGWRLGAGLIRFGSPARRFACAELVRGEFEPEPFDCLFGAGRQLRVACNPRATLLYGWLPRGGRRIDVVTSRRQFSQTGQSAHRLGIRRSAFLVELGADEALRSVTFPGHGTHRFRLPPATRQCGYAEDVTYR
jgi:hypothetical protein